MRWPPASEDMSTRAGEHQPLEDVTKQCSADHD
jgi:hypothetical protein